MQTPSIFHIHFLINNINYSFYDRKQEYGSS